MRGCSRPCIEYFVCSDSVNGVFYVEVRLENTRKLLLSGLVTALAMSHFLIPIVAQAQQAPRGKTRTARQRYCDDQKHLSGHAQEYRNHLSEKWDCVG